VRFTVEELKTVERFIERVNLSHPEDSLVLRSSDIRALASVASLVLMMTEPTIKQRIRAKWKSK
jgi:hypothetical protein